MEGKLLVITCNTYGNFTYVVKLLCGKITYVENLL